MADRQSSYPESATHGARTNGRDAAGEAELRAALAAHGDDLAAAVENTDELADLLTTAIVVAASAEDEDVDHLTDSAANLVRAADGLTTDGTADLAEQLGTDADALSAALETVVDLQREGRLEEAVAALDVVLELQREGNLDALVDTAETLSALELDEDAVRATNTLISGLGAAQRRLDASDIGGRIRALNTRDAAVVGTALGGLAVLSRRVRRR